MRAEEKIGELPPPSPRDFVRDPVLLEFLGMPETGRLLESDLKQRLIDHLQSFLLEVGKGLIPIRKSSIAVLSSRLVHNVKSCQWL